MTIVTEKITLSNMQASSNYSKSGWYRRVVSFSRVLGKDALPEEYFQEKESFYYKVVDNTGSLLKSNGDPLLSVDAVYSEETFQEALAFIRKAGDNLHRVRKNWKGIETFTI